MQIVFALLVLYVFFLGVGVLFQKIGRLWTFLFRREWRD